MDEDTLEMSRRKILAGMGTVGVASAGAGLGTSAYFNDTESFDGNTMTAGELDLRIDWQQRYWGPDAGPAYGSAGRPWVNAHPDHDDDGIQSLDVDGTVHEYTDESRNIQGAITCDTLTNEYDFGPAGDHLINLQDVKPGDHGEITFSFHLCDNPGYVWFMGELQANEENGYAEPEPEDDNGTGELAEAIQARAWYDVNCNNDYESGESIIFHEGNLKAFLDSISGDDSRLLDPLTYQGFEVQQEGGDTFEVCKELGKVNWENDTFEVDEDSDGDELSLGGYDHSFYLETDDGTQVEVGIDVIEENDDGEPLEVEFFLDEPQTDPGICKTEVFGGTITTVRTYEGLCVTGTNGRGLEVDGEVGSGSQPAISHITFYHCPQEDDGEFPPLEIPRCFDPDATYCIGFEWWVPTDVGNEIQTDSVEFDLGFYTEQCRHNEDPSGPGSTPS